MAWFSATIAAVLLAVVAVRYVENRLIAMAGEGLALSALNLADALNRTVVEAALVMQRLAVDEVIRTADEHELPAYLRRIRSVSSFFPMITVFDPEGRPKASTDGSKVAQIEGDYPKNLSVNSPGIYVFEETLTGREGFTLWVPLIHDAERLDGAVTMRIVLRDLLLGVPYVIPALLSSPTVHEYQVTGNDGTRLFDSTQGSIPSRTRQSHAPASAASMALNRSGYYSGYYVEEASESGPLVVGYADTNRGDRYAPIQWRISVAKKKAEIAGSFKRDLLVTAVGVGGTVGVAAGMACWLMYRSRKRRDEAERREAWSTQALNRIPHACIVTDAAGTVMFLNESAHALIGWIDKEARGKPLQDVFKPANDDSGTLRDMMTEAIRKKKATAGKPISVLTKAGVALSMTFRIEPLYSSTRTEHGYLMLFEKSETVTKNLHVSVASAGGEYSRHENGGGRVQEDRSMDWNRLQDVLGSTRPERVAIFQIQSGEGGARWASRRYEWIANGTAVHAGWPRWFSWSLAAKGFSRWEDLLGRGEIVAGLVRDFPPMEQTALSSCGIRSLVAVPIFHRGQWWGFVEFDQCTHERDWTETEVNGLAIAAGLVSSAVDDGRLQTFFQKLQAALEETREGILVTDQAGNLLHVNPRFVSMWGLPASAAELKRTDEVLAYMMDQLKTPETLRRTMIELDVQPDTDSYDMLERKDGRIIERSSKPTREADLPKGRVWIFRDVTSAGFPADAMMACSVPILERTAEA